MIHYQISMKNGNCLIFYYVWAFFYWSAQDILNTTKFKYLYYIYITLNPSLFSKFPTKPLTRLLWGWARTGSWPWSWGRAWCASAAEEAAGRCPPPTRLCPCHCWSPGWSRSGCRRSGPLLGWAGRPAWAPGKGDGESWYYYLIKMFILRYVISALIVTDSKESNI